MRYYIQSITDYLVLRFGTHWFLFRYVHPNRYWRAFWRTEWRQKYGKLPYCD